MAFYKSVDCIRPYAIYKYVQSEHYAVCTFYGELFEYVFLNDNSAEALRGSESKKNCIFPYTRYYKWSAIMFPCEPLCLIEIFFHNMKKYFSKDNPQSASSGRASILKHAYENLWNVFTCCWEGSSDKQDYELNIFVRFLVSCYLVCKQSILVGSPLTSYLRLSVYLNIQTLKPQHYGLKSVFSWEMTPNTCHDLLCAFGFEFAHVFEAIK